MDETVKFFILLAIGAAGVFFGFSLLVPAASLPAAFGSGSSLQANVLSVTGARSAGGGADSKTVFFMSYDNLQNIFPVTLADAQSARIITAAAADNYQTVFAGTTKGLFTSKDGGLNWGRIQIAGVKETLREPDLLSSSTVVLDILPAHENGEFFLSALNGGEGVVYRTENNFFTVERITNFKKEAVYAMSMFGNDLYIGVSNGQLLRYDMSKKTFETLSTYSQPITDMRYASDNFFYILLKNGALYRGASPYSDFTKVRIPGGGFFSSASVLQFADDGRGSIYIRTESGVFRSTNSGETFIKYSNIPLLEDKIDTFGVANGNIHILAAGRLYTSSVQDVNWQVKEVPYLRPLWNSYFIGGGKVLLTQ